MFPNLVIKVLDQFPKTSQKKETGRKMPKLEKALCQPQKRGEKVGLGGPRRFGGVSPTCFCYRLFQRYDMLYGITYMSFLMDSFFVF